MPYPNDQGNPDGAIPVYLTPLMRMPSPPVSPPATIAAGATYDTGAIVSGYNQLAAAATLTQTGVLAISRYIDPEGLIAIGDPITQAMTASVPATVAVNDGMPYASFRVTVHNTSGSTGTLTGFRILEKM